MTIYRVALVGTGAFAGTHVEALRAAGARVQLVAAVSPDAQRGQAFCSEYHIPAFYSDLAAMLAAEQPDLVHICTPPHTHMALAVACLEAGAHVLCEKPLCGALADFDRLIAIEQRSSSTLSTVFQWRFGAAAQYARQRIQAGDFGLLRLATCQTLWYRDMAYYSVPWRSQWATALGGTTMGHGIHLIDLLLWLLNDAYAWEEVQAVMGTLHHAIEVENVALALVRLQGGAFASISSSALSPRQETYLRLDFQYGTLEVKGLYGYTNADWQFTPSPDAPAELTWDVPGTQPGTLDAQVAALIASLDHATPPLVTGQEARRILAFITGLYQAAQTRQAVTPAMLTPANPFYHDLRGIR